MTASSAAVASRAAVPVINCKLDAVGGKAGVQIVVSGASVSVATGDPSSPTKLFGFRRNATYYRLDEACPAVKEHIVISKNGLSSSAAGPAQVDCTAPAHIVMRVVLDLDRSELPTSAKIEITRPRAPLRPLAQVRWTTAGSTTYFSGSCTKR